MNIIDASQEPLILASASPRRQRILAAANIPFEVVVPEVEESLVDDDPRRTVEHNARLKNDWCRQRHPCRAILSADTVVDFQGHCLAKPVSRSEATAMLRRFSGATQTVLTGVVLSTPATIRADIGESTVTFRELSTAEIHAYHALVNPLDKAGGYDIGQHGERIVAAQTGSRANIMGLPIELVAPWLGLGPVGAPIIDA